jgi:hypothetical protein
MPTVLHTRLCSSAPPPKVTDSTIHDCLLGDGSRVVGSSLRGCVIGPMTFIDRGCELVVGAWGGPRLALPCFLGRTGIFSYVPALACNALLYPLAHTSK